MTVLPDHRSRFHVTERRQMSCLDPPANHLPLKEIKDPKDRHCTDVLFLVLFVAFFGVTCWMAALAHNKGGDPIKIVRCGPLSSIRCGR